MPKEKGLPYWHEYAVYELDRPWNTGVLEYCEIWRVNDQHGEYLKCSLFFNLGQMYVEMYVN